MRRSPLYTAERIPCIIFSGNSKPSPGTIDRTSSRERAELIKNVIRYSIPSTLGDKAMILVELGDNYLTILLSTVLALQEAIQTQQHG